MENTPPAGRPKSRAAHLLPGCALIILGVSLAAGGIYVGETDDAPGAALLGLLLAGGLAFAGIKLIRRSS